MTELKQEVKTIRIQACCSTCKSIMAYKEPAFTDPIRGQGLIGHVYVCYNCDHEEMLDQKYPLIRYE